MINSSRIQIQTLPSNSLNSPYSSHIPFNFSNINVRKPTISIRRSLNFTPMAAATNGFYTPSPEKESLYDLLGIAESVTVAEIKRAYKQLALKYHPDVSPPDRADEYTMRFIMVQEAYETLSDPETRAMYDSCLAKGLQSAFSGKKGSRFEARSEERRWWKERWQVQLSELQRRSTADSGRVDRRGRMSWGARMRMERSEACGDGSESDQH